MPQVVVIGGIVKCSHGGQVRLTTGDNRLDVDDHAAVIQGQEVGLSFAPGAPGVIAPCPFTTPGGPSPCSATQAAAAGISVKLTIGGRGVILDTSGGVATNTPPATWSIQDAGQNKLAVDG